MDRLIEMDVQDSMVHGERVAFLAMMGAVIEALPDALIVSDDTGAIVLFNEQAEFMFGYHRGEMIGEPVERLLPARFRARHAYDRDIYNRFDISQRARSMGIGRQLLGIRRDGNEFPVDITLSRMVVPKGIFNLALIRFSHQAIDHAMAAHCPPARESPGELERLIDETDAGR